MTDRLPSVNWVKVSVNDIKWNYVRCIAFTLAPKLRHSFVGLNVDQTKTTRRPTSLISESSLSSGTSSSSLSKSSTTSSNSSVHNTTHHYQPGIGLELINESQTLDQHENNKSSNHHHHSVCHSHGTGTRIRNNHKRSTTIVSQLSMGIDFDLNYYCF